MINASQRLPLILAVLLLAARIHAEDEPVSDLKALNLKPVSAEVVKDVVYYHGTHKLTKTAIEGTKLVVVTLQGSAAGPCKIEINPTMAEFIFEDSPEHPRKTFGILFTDVNHWILKANDTPAPTATKTISKEGEVTVKFVGVALEACKSLQVRIPAADGTMVLLDGKLDVP